MYVVTRNSHQADIEAFLAARGVPCAGVLVAKNNRRRLAKIDIVDRLTACPKVSGIYFNSPAMEFLNARLRRAMSTKIQPFMRPLRDPVRRLELFSSWLLHNMKV